MKMWATSTMLLSFFFLISNLNIIQYGEATTPAATTPAATTPAATTPAAGATPAAGSSSTVGNLNEATSTFSNVLGELIQRLMQYKKNYLSTRLEMFSSAIANSTAQLGSLLSAQRPGAAATAPAPAPTSTPSPPSTPAR